MEPWRYGQVRFKHVWLRHPLERCRQAGAARSARPRPAAARRVCPHRQQHVGRRQPVDRRLVPDHRRHRRLGSLGRHQHSRPVRRPGRSPLPRPLRALGRRASISPSTSRGPRSRRSPRRRRRWCRESSRAPAPFGKGQGFGILKVLVPAIVRIAHRPFWLFPPERASLEDQMRSAVLTAYCWQSPSARRSWYMAAPALPTTCSRRRSDRSWRGTASSATARTTRRGRPDSGSTCATRP